MKNTPFAYSFPSFQIIQHKKSWDSPLGFIYANHLFVYVIIILGWNAINSNMREGVLVNIVNWLDD